MEAECVCIILCVVLSDEERKQDKHLAAELIITTSINTNK